MARPMTAAVRELGSRAEGRATSKLPPTSAEILARIPQRRPFRFVDEILSIDDDVVVATHRFRGTEDFYHGHFPGNPITPGVILIETMAQCALVTHAIYHFERRCAVASRPLVPLFVGADVEFHRIVLPGKEVRIRGELDLVRSRKIRSRVELEIDDGVVACSGVLTGMGVPA